MLNKKIYLGDGVYAQYDGYHIVLTTQLETGTQVIALDDSVLYALKQFQVAIRNWHQERRNPKPTEGNDEDC